MKRKNNIVKAREEAECRFLTRKPDSFMQVQINSRYHLVCKRHFIVYKNEESNHQSIMDLDLDSLKVPLFSNANGTITFAIANIMDKLSFGTELWMYIQTEKPVNSFLVCKSIAIAGNLDLDSFYTDELSNDRSAIKRYDYIKLKSFQKCMAMMRSELLNKTSSDFSSNAENLND